MKKSRVFAAAICTVFVFSLTLNSNLFSKAENTSVTVLSHSSYVNSNGHFIVVGEVQHTSNHASESVSLNVIISAINGTQIAAGTVDVFVNNFLAQQKAPFYLDFGKIDFNSIPEAINFNISLSNAPPTNYYQYPDFSLNVAFNGIANDVYTVSGTITNTGNQTANNVKIYGTYYNNAGIVVAVGAIALKEPLTSTSSANFTLSEFDASPKLVTKISNYALLIQTSTQVFSAPPTASTSDSQQSSNSSVLTLSAVSLLAIAVIVGIALVFLRKHRT